MLCNATASAPPRRASGSAYDWCAIREALYECIDTIQYSRERAVDGWFGGWVGWLVRECVKRREVFYGCKQTDSAKTGLSMIFKWRYINYY